MQLRRLGNSDLDITPIGFGAWAVGGSGWPGGWGHQKDDDSVAAINRALDLGINWIDTAAVYGLGHSEEVVGRALEGRAERPYVFTKCSRVVDENGQLTGRLKRDSIRQECEESLRRLRTEAIDLYQIHWPNPEEDIEEAWSTLAELQKEGKVRWIGVSNFDAGQLERISKIAPVTSLQPPYSAIRREVEEETLPYCQENGIGVIVYSPMGSGLLTGKMTRERIAALPEDDWRKNRNDPQFQEPKLSQNLAVAEQLEEVGWPYDRSAGEVAIAWALRNPAVTGAIVGLRRPDQVDGIIGAGEFQLSDADAARIESAMDGAAR